MHELFKNFHIQIYIIGACMNIFFLEKLMPALGNMENMMHFVSRCLPSLQQKKNLSCKIFVCVTIKSVKKNI